MHIYRKILDSEFAKVSENAQQSTYWILQTE